MVSSHSQFSCGLCNVNQRWPTRCCPSLNLHSLIWILNFSFVSFAVDFNEISAKHFLANQTDQTEARCQFEINAHSTPIDNTAKAPPSHFPHIILRVSVINSIIMREFTRPEPYPNIHTPTSAHSNLFNAIESVVGSFLTWLYSERCCGSLLSLLLRVLCARFHTQKAKWMKWKESERKPERKVSLSRPSCVCPLIPLVQRTEDGWNFKEVCRSDHRKCAALFRIRLRYISLLAVISY